MILLKRIPVVGVFLLWMLCAVGMGPGFAEDSWGGTVVINGAPLNPEQIAQLQQMVGAVTPGEYWYDNVSGLWGYKGGPYSGQIYPGLNLGGAASTGRLRRRYRSLYQRP